MFRVKINKIDELTEFEYNKNGVSTIKIFKKDFNNFENIINSQKKFYDLFEFQLDGNIRDDNFNGITFLRCNIKAGYTINQLGKIKLLNNQDFIIINVYKLIFDSNIESINASLYRNVEFNMLKMNITNHNYLNIQNNEISLKIINYCDTKITYSLEAYANISINKFSMYIEAIKNFYSFIFGQNTQIYDIKFLNDNNKYCDYSFYNATLEKKYNLRESEILLNLAKKNNSIYLEKWIEKYEKNRTSIIFLNATKTYGENMLLEHLFINLINCFEGLCGSNTLNENILDDSKYKLISDELISQIPENLDLELKSNLKDAILKSNVKYITLRKKLTIVSTEYHDVISKILPEFKKIKRTKIINDIIDTRNAFAHSKEKFYFKYIQRIVKLNSYLKILIYAVLLESVLEFKKQEVVDIIEKKYWYILES